jgi:ABC-2 type transport system ATP-binding protein
VSLPSGSDPPPASVVGVGEELADAVEPAVTVENVSKTFRLYHERNQSLKVALLRRRRATYEELWALRDVSFTVPRGQTFALIGENGSGKSTLLKCIARILRPESGRTAVDGKVSALLELGAGFHPELSGRDNIFLNGSILGLSKRHIEERFDEIVDFAGLDRFIDTPVKNYSSGMYVRLGFSVAINVDPDVLLVDEVLAVGDEQFQRKCAEKFADLRARGKTIVIVSHSLSTVRSVCDHAAWLQQGRLRMVGPAPAVIDAYIDEVHTEREAEPDSSGGGGGAGGAGAGARWGSGEGRIERAEILDHRGAPTLQVRTGEAMTVRLHFSVTQPIERPVFGIAIHTLEGTHVTGPNSREAGCVPDRVEGAGHVDVTVDRLLLLPGTYDLTVAFTDYSALHPFDYRHRVLRFDVEAGEPRESYGGLVSLGGRWSVHASATDNPPSTDSTVAPALDPAS